jgi:hypothetical protein
MKTMARHSYGELVLGEGVDAVFHGPIVGEQIHRSNIMPIVLDSFSGTPAALHLHFNLHKIWAVRFSRYCFIFSLSSPV